MAIVVLSMTMITTLSIEEIVVVIVIVVKCSYSSYSNSRLLLVPLNCPELEQQGQAV